MLVEGPSPDSELVWQARLPSQAPAIDGVCYISDPGEYPLEAGQIRRMRITKAHDYDLTGELTDVPDASNRFAVSQLAAAAPALVQIRSALPPDKISPMTLCPICRKPVQLDDPYMPFCSDRCRIQDLGNWATGKYVIPGRRTEEEGIPDKDEE